MTRNVFAPKRDLEIPDVEQPFRKYAERRGWLFEKVISNSRKGWPDRFLARKDNGTGRRHGIYLVELKRPGEEPTEQQALRHKELQDHGVNVVWFDDLEAAKAFFK